MLVRTVEMDEFSLSKKKTTTDIDLYGNRLYKIYITCKYLINSVIQSLIKVFTTQPKAQADMLERK